MKFVELKKSLSDSIANIYLIEGEDRFVVQSSLKLIENAINLSMPDVNRIVLDSDKLSVDSVLESLESYPFGDLKKLIVVKEPKFNASEFKKLEVYLKNPSEYNVVVFISYTSSDCTKKLKNYAEFVDANKLDELSVKKWIGAKLSKNNKQIAEQALVMLIEYTSGDLTRLESELNKLICVKEEIITKDVIEMFVVPDKDYQIYELLGFIASGNSEKVYDLIEVMQETEKNNMGLIQYLYGAFRKLLIVSLSKKTDMELAEEFKTKPFAVKQMRVQAGKFTPKILKKINKELGELEEKLKSGKANLDNAVHFAIAKILLEK